MQRLRKIVSVNTADRGGGAEQVAWSLFKGFQRRRLESWLVVGDKKTDDPHVLPFFASPFLNYQPYADPHFQAQLQHVKSRDAADGIEDFHFPYTQALPTITGSPPDVLLCHNLHGSYFDLHELAPLSHRLPVCLVLHDSWCLTGHCACPIGCSRWQVGCGRCPDLALPPRVEQDRTHFNWARKRSIFARTQLYATAPTQWLLHRARRSILAPAILDSRVIPCGVDTTLFFPGARTKARRELNLPLDVHLLLFAANGLRSNPYKDLATIEAAVCRLARSMPDEKILFVGLGEAGREQRIGASRLCFVPYQPSQEVAKYLRAADLYLHAAREENFGLITAEAQACGTPVVATAVGGLPEVVADGRRGLLVPPGDAAAMAEAVRRLLLDRPLRLQFGAECAKHARRFWHIDRVVETYLSWFAEMRTAFPKREARAA